MTTTETQESFTKGQKVTVTRRNFDTFTKVWTDQPEFSAVYLGYWRNGQYVVREDAHQTLVYVSGADIQAETRLSLEEALWQADVLRSNGLAYGELNQRVNNWYTPIPTLDDRHNHLKCNHGLADTIGYVVAYSHINGNDVTFTDIAYVEGANQYGKALVLVREARAKVAAGQVDAAYAVIHHVYTGGHRYV